MFNPEKSLHLTADINSRWKLNISKTFRTKKKKIEYVNARYMDIPIVWVTDYLLNAFTFREICGLSLLQNKQHDFWRISPEKTRIKCFHAYIIYNCRGNLFPFWRHIVTFYFRNDFQAWDIISIGACFQSGLYSKITFSGEAEKLPQTEQ